jgi:iron complex transport system substrate-binding protein
MILQKNMINFINTKLYFILSLFTLSAFLFCNNKNENSSQTNIETKKIKDMLGNTVVIPKEVKRVALFGGPTGQIAYLLGAQDKLCAVTSTIRLSKLVQEMDPNIKNIPAPRTVSGSINIEELIMSNPELVLAGDIDGEIVKRKTDIPVALLLSSMKEGFEAIKNEVKFFAEIFNKHDRATYFIDYLDKTVNMIKERTKDIPAEKRKIVYNGYQKNHLVTIGGDMFIQEFIETAGCRNAAATISTKAGRKEGLHQGLGVVSMEQVIEWDPDIIVINMENSDDMYKDARWSQIRAVRNKAIYKQPTGIFILDRPTVESAFLYTLWIAKTAYPEKFHDVDMNKEVKKFYKEIFGFKLSDSQVKNILNGSYAKSMQKGMK